MTESSRRIPTELRRRVGGECLCSGCAVGARALRAGAMVAAAIRRSSGQRREYQDARRCSARERCGIGGAEGRARSRRLGSYEATLDAAVATYSYRPGYPAGAEDLGFAVGFDASPQLRAKLTWTAIACVVVLAAFLLARSRCRTRRVRRRHVLPRSWLPSPGPPRSTTPGVTPQESSLLRLAPSWPHESKLKPSLAKVAAHVPTGCLAGVACSDIAVTRNRFDESRAGRDQRRGHDCRLDGHPRELAAENRLARSGPIGACRRFSPSALRRSARSESRYEILVRHSASRSLIAAPAVVGAVLFRRRPVAVSSQRRRLIRVCGALRR